MSNESFASDNELQMQQNAKLRLKLLTMILEKSVTSLIALQF